MPTVLLRQVMIQDQQSSYHNTIADVTIADGIITKIAAAKGKKTKSTILVDGEEQALPTQGQLSVSPGWVDVLADYCEPGYEHKETIQTGLDAAAAGGFTNVLLAPNTNPGITTKSGVQYIRNKAAGHVVALHPLGAISQNIEGKDLAEMMDMRSHGAIAFTDGWKPVQNANLMMKALEYVRAFDGVLIQLPIYESLAKGGLMHEGELSTRLGMAGIPGLAETLQVHRDIELLRYTGGRLHITGISCSASVAMIKAAKKEGLSLTCSVTPYHLALTDAALNGYDSLYKVMQPLRSEADRKALIAGLKDGTIDCIASHHRPQDWDAKTKEFEYAANGMNIQEHAFAIAWQSVRERVGVDRMVEALNAPRKIFGLPAATIAPKHTADITIFATDGEWTPTHSKSLGINNPFLNKPMNGGAIGIINDDKIHLNQ